MAQKATLTAARNAKSFLLWSQFCVGPRTFLYNAARKETCGGLIFRRFHTKEIILHPKNRIQIFSLVDRAFQSFMKNKLCMKRTAAGTFLLLHKFVRSNLILLFISSGSLLFAKNVSEIIFIEPLLLAKCNASPDFTKASFAEPQVKTSNIWRCEQKSFLTWMFQDLVPLGLRAAQLFCLFTPMVLTYPLTYLGPQWFGIWLKLLYLAVEYSGATFIKLGQWASTRRDLFSKEVCDHFAHLHFQVRPHAWAHTAHILHEAYGELWQQMLHLVDGQSPIGSGCIAQVSVIQNIFCMIAFIQSIYLIHLFLSVENNDKVNYLKETASEAGTDLIPVAIKVLHPSIQDKFNRDMTLMKSAARFLTWLFPKLHWVNLSQCVEEFKSVMEAQVNTFLCLFKHITSCHSPSDDWLYLFCLTLFRVPRPFPHLVRHNILVESFEEGISVGQIVQDSSQPAELKIQLANIGVDIMLQMVFVNNFVHADLHPGNLLVQNMDAFFMKVSSYFSSHLIDELLEDHRQVSKEKDCLRLVLLDCGITSSLEPEDKQKFQEVFTAVVKGEGETVADLFLAKSAVNFCEDPICFRKEMAQVVRDARQNLASISKIKVAEVMNAVFGVLSRHRIQLEANFATIILAMAMLEGLGRSLNPDLDLLEKARPVLLGSYLSRKNAGP
ncbi:hypothetical protein EGW08_003057 [Elysia chlorotica]|uniref:ABC1 atypical kinase-like domain-containing protein n=1 Tax=Elysia chlorotica TaxID=188477 RepID=A0A433U663_ELYCH|nr:hypothetical protein EGW08_003057 [Elysia chlorotica]